MARSIDRDEVRRLMEQGAQIVDVLPAPEYAEDHLPGAVNLPLRKIETEALGIFRRPSTRRSASTASSPRRVLTRLRFGQVRGER